MAPTGKPAPCAAQLAQAARHRIAATPAAPGSNPYGLAYDSGATSTYDSFAQQHGHFEMRAQLPAGTGPWPGPWVTQPALAVMPWTP